MLFVRVAGAGAGGGGSGGQHNRVNLAYARHKEMEQKGKGAPRNELFWIHGQRKSGGWRMTGGGESYLEQNGCKSYL